MVATANLSSYRAWCKNTPAGFYEIDFAWRRSAHLRRGRFSPDIFIQVSDALTLVVEIKDDDEVAEPTEENRQKYQFATDHFDRVNEELAQRREQLRYKFNFLTPRQFNVYFQSLVQVLLPPSVRS